MNRDSGPMGAEEINLQKAQDKLKSADTEMNTAKGILETAEAFDKGLDGLNDMHLVREAEDLTKDHVARDIQKRSNKRN